MTLTEVSYVMSRLQDYWGRNTTWQRRLWNPGTISMLGEVKESALLLHEDHLAERQVKEFAQATRAQVGRDLGLGSDSLRQAVNLALSQIPDDQAVRRLGHLIDEISPKYLQNWRQAWGDSRSSTELELTSRKLAGHVLGLGFSPEGLYRWLDHLVRTSPPPTVEGLIEQVCDVASRAVKEYEVLIPVHSMPSAETTSIAAWRTAAETSAWIAAEHPGRTASIRQSGSFLLTVGARDPWGAVEVASALIQSVAARVSVAFSLGKTFSMGDRAFVKNSTREFSLKEPRRQVELKSLQRPELLLNPRHEAFSGRLSAVLDLAALVETGPPESAVAGGWAAVEILLRRKGVGSLEQTKELAAVVACSLPRAELTTLAYAYQNENGDLLASQLDSAPTNRERCRLLEAAFKSGASLEFSKESDQTAEARIRTLILQPTPTLRRIQQLVNAAFLRLYRQRNLVLHGGRIESDAMSTTMMMTPALLGAAIDRFVHTSVNEHLLEPADLVARAEIAIQLCGESEGRGIADLLEAP
jgi:hypothetical protein